jgi:hypothetical protein
MFFDLENWAHMSYCSYMRCHLPCGVNFLPICVLFLFYLKSFPCSIFLLLLIAHFYITTVYVLPSTRVQILVLKPHTGTPPAFPQLQEIIFFSSRSVTIIFYLLGALLPTFPQYSEIPGIVPIFT